MRTANIYYVIPQYRCAAYAIGMITALLLRGQRRWKLSSRDLKFGWIYASLALITAYGISVMTHLDHSRFNMSLYTAFAPSFLAIFLVWIIFFRQQGHESKKKLNF